MDPSTFLLATLALLATPGPTNTLLATSGAAVGVRRSLPLLAAELGGYLIAIGVLRAVIGPVVAAVPAFGIALRVVVVLYLLLLARLLWRHGACRLDAGGPVTFGGVLVTTLLNPKAIIFAFTLLPTGNAAWSLAPWLAALSVSILLVGCSWIIAGAGLRSGFASIIPARIGYRASAVALALLAGGIGTHAVGMGVG